MPDIKPENWIFWKRSDVFRCGNSDEGILASSSFKEVWLAKYNSEGNTTVGLGERIGNTLYPNPKLSEENLKKVQQFILNKECRNQSGANLDSVISVVENIPAGTKQQ